MSEQHVHVHLHMPLRHAWLKHFIKDFETNPQLQYRIHMTFTYVWLVNMAVVLLVFLFLPGVWAAVSILFLLLISLYANFATDYGAVSAALAAGTAPATPESLLPEIKHDLESIRQHFGIEESESPTNTKF